MGSDVGGAVNEFKKAMKDEQVADKSNSETGTTIENELNNKTK